MISRVVAWMLVVPSVLAIGQSRDAAPAPRAALNATGQIAGIVVSADGSRQAVRRVIVTLSGSQLPIGLSAITDDDGRFAIRGVPAGRYNLVATKPAYLRASYGSERPDQPGIALPLADGQQLDNITIRMLHGAAISGVVKDTLGRPKQVVRITAFRERRTGGFSDVAATTLTDDLGRYRLFGLAPGAYLVATSFTLNYSGSQPWSSPTSRQIDAIFAALEHRQAPGASHADIVQPAPEISVPVFYPGVPTIALATRVTVAAGDDRAGADIVMNAIRSATVEGTIVSPGGSLPRITTSMTLGSPAPPILLIGPRPYGMQPGDNRFRFVNVTPGHYVILARTSANGSDNSGSLTDSQWARAEVDVEGTDISGLTLSLQSTVRLRGRVVFDAGTLAPPKDVTTLRVLLPRRDAVRNAWSPEVAPNALVGPNAAFTIGNIVPGSFGINVTPVPVGWWLRSAIVNGKDILDEPLDIAPNASEVGDAILTFSDRHTLLSGTLQTGAAAAPSSYFIVVFPDDAALWGKSTRRVQAVRPASDGVFTVRDLPPGNYRLGALNDFEPDDLLDPAFLGRLAGASTTLTLADGEQKTQNLTLRAGK